MHGGQNLCRLLLLIRSRVCDCNLLHQPPEPESLVAKNGLRQHTVRMAAAAVGAGLTARELVALCADTAPDRSRIPTQAHARTCEKECGPRWSTYQRHWSKMEYWEAM